MSGAEKPRPRRSVNDDEEEEEQPAISFTSSGRMAKKRTFFNPADKLFISPAKLRKMEKAKKPEKVQKTKENKKSEKKKELRTVSFSQTVSIISYFDESSSDDDELPPMTAADVFGYDETARKKNVSFDDKITIHEIPNRREIRWEESTDDEDEVNEFFDDVKRARFGQSASIRPGPSYLSGDELTDEMVMKFIEEPEEVDSDDDVVMDEEDGSDAPSKDTTNEMMMQELRIGDVVEPEDLAVLMEQDPEPELLIEDVPEHLISSKIVLKMLRALVKTLELPGLKLEENDADQQIPLKYLLTKFKNDLINRSVTSSEATSAREFFLALRAIVITLHSPDLAEFENYVSSTLKELRENDIKIPVENIRFVLESTLAAAQ